MPNETSAQAMGLGLVAPVVPPPKRALGSGGNAGELTATCLPEENLGRRSTLAPALVDNARTRPITVAVDRTVVRIPRLGHGAVSEQLFDEVESPADQAFILALIESVLAGSATRMVRSIVGEMCGPSVPASLVRDRAARLGRAVGQWNARDLSGQSYPFMFLTSCEVGIRRQGATFRHSALIAAGISQEGYREVLGIDVVPSLPVPDLAAFFSGLKRRGMQGVDVVISADARGLTSALQGEFPEAMWQRSQDETIKSVLRVSPDSVQMAMKRLLKSIFDSSSLQSALDKARDPEGLEIEAPEAFNVLRSSLPSALSVMSLPSTYRTRLRTTRLVDRISQDVQRRAHVVRTFPNLESAVRLVGSMAMQVDHSWIEGQRYLSMESYRAWRKPHRSAPVPTPK